jgi:hypothetical protein
MHQNLHNASRRSSQLGVCCFDSSSLSTAETAEGCSRYKVNVTSHQEQPTVARPVLVQILSHLLKTRCQFVHYLGVLCR